MKQEFTELLYKNQGVVHKICNLYFRDRPEKEDYQQELIIQLWKAFPSFKSTSKFSTWMYRVCINAAIDIIRKEKNQLKQVNMNTIEVRDTSNINEMDHSNQEKLYEAINKLSDVDRAIITLYLDEYSYQEISDMIGISKSNTGVKINRIKTEIIKALKNGDN